MHGITAKCQDEPHGSFSWPAPLLGEPVPNTLPGTQEGEGALTPRTLLLPLLRFIFLFF